MSSLLSTVTDAKESSDDVGVRVPVTATLSSADGLSKVVTSASELSEPKQPKPMSSAANPHAGVIEIRKPTLHAPAVHVSIQQGRLEEWFPRIHATRGSASPLPTATHAARV